MGFLGGITQQLFGGSSGSSQQQATSGWGLLPPDIQKTYTTYANALTPQIANATQDYTPLPQTAGETQAYNSINQGFAPTQQSLNSDLSMLQNPYNSSVIDQINKQAGGQYSVLKQALDQTGTYNSNRQVLGANDIENTRQSNIGSMLSGQYNTSIGQILNNIIPQRQQDAQNKLAAGANQRTLAGQQSSAPIAGLQQIAAALGILPTSGGSQSTGSSEQSSSKGLFGGLTG